VAEGATTPPAHYEKFMRQKAATPTSVTGGVQSGSIPGEPLATRVVDVRHGSHSPEYACAEGRIARDAPASHDPLGEHGRFVRLLAEDQVYHPAPPDMRPDSPAMCEDIRVGAAGVFEGYGRDWRVVVGTASRQWARMSGSVQPASLIAVARIGRSSKVCSV
jgi:hypothetical protein